MPEFDQQWLLEIKRQEPKGKMAGFVLGVCQWIVDGEPKRPTLEKREIYGNGKTGKCKGLNFFDLLEVEKRMADIKGLLHQEQQEPA